MIRLKRLETISWAVCCGKILHWLKQFVIVSVWLIHCTSYYRTSVGRCAFIHQSQDAVVEARVLILLANAFISVATFYSQWIQLSLQNWQGFSSLVLVFLDKCFPVLCIYCLYYRPVSYTSNLFNLFKLLKTVFKDNCFIPAYLTRSPQVWLSAAFSLDRNSSPSSNSVLKCAAADCGMLGSQAWEWSLKILRKKNTVLSERCL